MKLDIARTYAKTSHQGATTQAARVESQRRWNGLHKAYKLGL
ncbi:MAG: hypothetical protein V4568_02505 [Pseudomonadota bacterium]